MSLNGILSRLFKNLHYKIASLILATLFWYIVQGETIVDIVKPIQITVDVADGYMVKGSSTRFRDATLRAPRVLLAKYSSQQPLEANISIPEGKVGQIKIRISKQHIKDWNNRIKLTIHDAYLTLYVDKKATRTLPIKEHVKGVPADGYIIEKTAVKPGAVTVTGLKSQIDKLNYVLTEPIDITGIQQTKSFEARLSKEENQDANFSIEKVSVSLQVGEKKINKRFGSIAVEIEGNAYQAQVRPRYVSIVIQGTPGILSFIKRSDLRAFLDARELKPGRYEKKIQVKIPPDTVLIETFPENAIVEVSSTKRLN